MCHRELSVPTFMAVMQQNGMRIVPYHGDALIERARSIAATEWLLAQTDSDVVIQTDDDFWFTPPGLASLIDLCRKTKGIVAGVTPLRSGDFTAIVPLDHGLDEPWTDEHAPPQLIKWAGGLIAYHRSVFERLAKTLPLLHEGDSIPSFYPFFHTSIYDHPSGRKILLSEDYACHERAGELGIPVWVQPACQVGHLAQIMITSGSMQKIREIHQEGAR